MKYLITKGSEPNTFQMVGQDDRGVVVWSVTLHSFARLIGLLATMQEKGELFPNH